MSKSKSTIPVVILCGGMGTRLAEETETKPKPLVEIGGRPILWHIMKTYSSYGYNEFILCLGYKGHLIRDYFLNYDFNTHDIRINLGERSASGSRGKVRLLGPNGSEDNWNVTLAETGNSSNTGARVKRIEKYVDADTFMLTYGDGVAAVDIRKLVAFHESHGRIGTVTGVRPPSRFGELVIDTSRDGGKDRHRVQRFAEKPEIHKLGDSVSGFINGGFFVFSKEFFGYLKEDDGCILEKKPLEKLSRDKQLMMYRHAGFWQCMDTMRDVTLLRDLWASGKPPWKVWKK